MIINQSEFLEACEYYVEQLAGGLASGKKPSEFDQSSLYKGINVEVEHTEDPMIALEIAMDHLTEDPEYYTKLALMEAH